MFCKRLTSHVKAVFRSVSGENEFPCSPVKKSVTSAFVVEKSRSFLIFPKSFLLHCGRFHLHVIESYVLSES